jgi:Cu-Zn family superoxide dismutase
MMINGHFADSMRHTMKVWIRRVTAPAYAVTVLGAAIVAACSDGSQNASGIPDSPPSALIGNVATAELRPANDSSVSGTVRFVQVDDALRVDAAVAGLGDGDHGWHIHENGDCSAADASSAGGHWSPDRNPHGAPTDPATQRHAGDLGNLTAASDGTSTVTRSYSELTLVGEYGVVGHSLIVHSGPEDFDSQPGGDAGDRISCGVIEWGTASG